MSLHRFDVDATAGPARETVIGGSQLLVRVRLFNDGDVANAFSGQTVVVQDVCCDLRPGEARELAFTLLCCAAQAERVTAQADGWSR